MFIFGLIVGFLLGGVVVGELAHRRPNWFAKVVAVTNETLDKVK